MRKFLAAALAVLVFVLPARAEDKYENIHTVAILVALGDVTVTDGEAPFGAYKDWTLDVADWTLDDLVTRRIAALLLPRFAVKEIAFDRGAFTATPPQRPIDELFVDSEETIVKRLALALPRDNGIDAYIVARRSWVVDPQNSWTLGLAVQRNWKDERATVYTNFVLEVVDAKTGEIIGRSGSHIEKENFWNRARPAAIGKIGKHWAPNKESFTAEHAANVKGAMLMLLDYAVPYTLYRLELTKEPDMPPMSRGTLPTPALGAP